MAKIPHLIILLVLLISVVAAKTPVNAIARREYIPFIKCQVCEKIAQQINDQIKKKESQISSKKASQYEIVEIFQKVCKLKKDGADWILQTNIVENGDILELVDQGTEGQCNSECKTIEHACQEIIGEWDIGVAEYVYKSQPSVDTLVNFLCEELSEACSVKAPPVPKNRIPGEPFIAKPSKDAEMEEILRPMEGMPGAPGMKMCSRDDLMNMNKFGDEDADDDDDDNFPGKLGNILIEEESTKKDMMQKILEGVKDVGAAVEGSINKVSGLFKSWLGGEKTGTKTTEKGKTEL